MTSCHLRVSDTDIYVKYLLKLKVIWKEGTVVRLRMVPQHHLPKSKDFCTCCTGLV